MDKDAALDLVAQARRRAEMADAGIVAQHNIISDLERGGRDSTGARDHLARLIAVQELELAEMERLLKESNDEAELNRVTCGKGNSSSEGSARQPPFRNLVPCPLQNWNLHGSARILDQADFRKGEVRFDQTGLGISAQAGRSSICLVGRS